MSRIKGILRSAIVITDLLLVIIFGPLYFLAWRGGEEVSTLIISAGGVLLGLALFSGWMYWIGVRLIKDIPPNETVQENAGLSPSQSDEIALDGLQQNGLITRLPPREPWVIVLLAGSLIGLFVTAIYFAVWRKLGNAKLVVALALLVVAPLAFSIFVCGNRYLMRISVPESAARHPRLEGRRQYERWLLIFSIIMTCMNILGVFLIFGAKPTWLGGLLLLGSSVIYYFGTKKWAERYTRGQGPTTERSHGKQPTVQGK